MSMMDNKILVTFTVNGRQVEVLTAPNRTLLEVLREDLGLIGTKQGCDDSNCGVCTVIVDKKAVKSCCMLIGQAEGTNVTTIEGLEGENGLHPLQQAFIDHFAIQCGFCTPAMILSAKHFWMKSKCDEDEIREALHGNICRCTGYKKIIEAIEAARDEMNAQA